MKTVRTALAITAVCAGAWAQIVDLTLFHADVDALPAPAREAYEEAVAAADRVDQIGAVNHMVEAAQAAPDVLEIQWLLCQVAESHVRGDNFGVEGALEVADQVVAAYERILDSEQLPDWARPIVERYERRLLDLVDNIDEMIESRTEIGNDLIHYRADLRVRVEEATERHAAQIREERRQNPTGWGGVNTRDAVQANPMLLPSDHYDHGQIRGRRDAIGVTDPRLLPSDYHR